MNPKFILLQPTDKSLEPVCYRVKGIMWETRKTITLDLEAHNNVTIRKKRTNGILFERMPYGWGNYEKNVKRKVS